MKRKSYRSRALRQPRLTPRRRVVESASEVPDEFKLASRGQRLQKVMAQAGVASRRECESMITQGRVAVNGQPVTALPAWVDEQADRIEVDGRVVRITPVSRSRPSSRDCVYVLLNKPRNVVTTTSDPQNRRCVTDLVDLQRPVRLYPVGRLDADSTGLILLTNDGNLAHRLTHPRYGVPKQYIVSVRGRLSQDDLDRLRQGLHLTDQKASPRKLIRIDGRPQKRGALATKRASVTRVNVFGYQRDRGGVERTKLEITLHEGQNRQIRRLLARLGYKVRRLQRVGIGPLTIKGLTVGHWRLLTSTEIDRLRLAAGLASGGPQR